MKWLIGGVVLFGLDIPLALHGGHVGAAVVDAAILAVLLYSIYERRWAK